MRFCDECGAPLGGRRSGRRARGARRRAAARLGPVRRPRRLHAAVRGSRRGGGARAALAATSRRARTLDRALRRHGREVHRRRGDGRLGRAGRARGRRRARRARRARARRRRRRRSARTPAPTLPAARRRAHRRGRGHARRRGTGHGRRRPRQHRGRASSRPPSRARCSSARRRAARPSAAIAYEDAGDARAEGQGRAGRSSGARCGWPRRVAGRCKSAGLEPPFVGRDRELRLLKELFHARGRGRQRAHLRLGDRHRRDRQVAARLGVREVRRRARRRRLLAPGPLPRLRRRRRVLGARRDGAHARAASPRTRTPTTALREAAARRSTERSSTGRASAPGSSRGSRTCSGSASRSRSSGRDLFSAWRLFFERLAERPPGRARVRGPAVGGRGLLDFIEYLLEWSRRTRSSCSRWPGPSSPSAGRAGAPARRSSTTLCARAAVGPGDGRAARRVRARAARRALRGRSSSAREGVPLYAVETVRMLLDRGLLAARGRPSTGHRRRSSALEVPETLHALIAARLDGLAREERRLLAGRRGARQDVHAAQGSRRSPACAEAELEPLLGSLVRKEVLSVQADPALARARPVRLPPGPAQARRLRDALEAGAAGAAPRRGRAPRARPPERRTRSSR